METKVRRFLEFNGKAILFLNYEGKYWIAIRPICEALGVNYNRIYQNLINDPILKDVFAKQQMHDTKNRLQSMVALPEKYIYGWLFSIRSGSDALQNYKLKCYDILYEYFHGAIAERHFHLTEKSAIENQIAELKEKLNENSDYLLLQELTAREMRISKTLKQLDADLLNRQLKLFN
jgi:hypothetical protein